MRDEELLTQLRAQAAQKPAAAEPFSPLPVRRPPAGRPSGRQTLLRLKSGLTGLAVRTSRRLHLRKRHFPNEEARIFSDEYTGTAPRIFQLLPALGHGDAVSNDACALDRLLRRRGLPARLYARILPPDLQNRVAWLAGEELPALRANDILLYHLSTGDAMNRQLSRLPGHKVIVYHNVTPPDFFAPYDRKAAEKCAAGYEQVRALAGTAEYALADSPFNAAELRRLGYTCPIDVVPILIPFEDYKQEPDAAVLKKYQDGRTNILFVGRIAPNKRQEDIIRAFDCYKRTYDPAARLFLVGSYEEGDAYYISLCNYCRRLGVQDVIFPGHISFAEILAYYRAADLFLCMSDHEGFCVPLVEAMCFDLPIVAKDTTAVGDTLGGAGLLLPDADPALAAAAMERVLRDSELQARFAAGRRAQLERFSYARVSEDFKNSFERFLTQTGLEP